MIKDISENKNPEYFQNGPVHDQKRSSEDIKTSKCSKVIDCCKRQSSSLDGRAAKKLNHTSPFKWKPKNDKEIALCSLIQSDFERINYLNSQESVTECVKMIIKNPEILNLSVDISIGDKKPITLFLYEFFMINIKSNSNIDFIPLIFIIFKNLDLIKRDIYFLEKSIINKVLQYIINGKPENTNNINLKVLSYMIRKMDSKMLTKYLNRKSIQLYCGSIVTIFYIIVVKRQWKLINTFINKINSIDCDIFDNNQECPDYSFSFLFEIASHCPDDLSVKIAKKLQPMTHSHQYLGVNHELKGSTPFFTAVLNRKWPLFSILLDKIDSIDLSEVSKDKTTYYSNQTLLWYVMITDDWKMTEKVVDKAKSLDCMFDYIGTNGIDFGMTPLHYALLKKQSDLAIKMLEKCKKVNPNLQVAHPKNFFYGLTPLMIAIQKKEWNIADIILEKSDFIDTELFYTAPQEKQTKKITVLDLAEQSGRKNLIEKIKQKAKLPTVKKKRRQKRRKKKSTPVDLLELVKTLPKEEAALPKKKGIKALKPKEKRRLRKLKQKAGSKFQEILNRPAVAATVQTTKQLIQKRESGRTSTLYSIFSNAVSLRTKNAGWREFKQVAENLGARHRNTSGDHYIMGLQSGGHLSIPMKNPVAVGTASTIKDTLIEEAEQQLLHSESKSCTL